MAFHEKIGEVSLQKSLRKPKLLALLLALFVCIFVLIDALNSEEHNIHVLPIDSDSLILLKIILIAASVYGLVVVVCLHFWRTAVLNRLSSRQSRFPPEVRFLMINYVLLVTPALYGQLLLYCGISTAELLYFVGASILATLAWAIYDLRLSQ